MIVFIFAMLPSIYYFGDPNVANQLNITFYNTSQALQTMVIANVSKVAFGNCPPQSTASCNNNRTTGFFANINLFTAPAFILAGFGYVAQALLNMPNIVGIMVSATATVFAIPVYNLAGDTALFIGFLSFLIVGLGISYYGKFNLFQA